MRALRPAAAAALALAPALGAQTIAITGGKVFPVSGAPIERGTVVITNGTITAVGANVPVPAGAQVIDATGKWVTPGFFDSETRLGVVEVSGVADTRDNAARAPNGIAAAFRVWEGLNPASVLVPPARNEGITSVIVAPQGGIVAGQSAVADLVEGSPALVIRKAPAAVVASLGSHVNGAARAEQLARLRALLDDAKAYPTRKAKITDGQTKPLAGSVADLEALQPVLAGAVPLAISADRASDIESALDLAKDYKLKLVILQGAEAWKVAPRLAAAKVPVVTGGINGIPQTFASLGQRTDNAALLAKAGVPVAFLGDAYGDEDGFNVRNLRYEAGNAVAAGLPWDAALRAVTLTPAEAWGVAGQVGSLAPGKAANVVVWSGDPFEFLSRPEVVIAHGQRVTSRTRQDELTDRYKRQPPAYRAP